MEYTDLLIEADKNNLITKDKPLRGNEGRIKGNRIAIKKDLPEIRKKCVLAEELGHHYTSSGDILDQEDISNKKQELHARLWAYDRLIGLAGIIECYEAGCMNLYDMTEHLGVTEDFLSNAISYYKDKYGTYARQRNYVVIFAPVLAVLKLKDKEE